MKFDDIDNKEESGETDNKEEAQGKECWRRVKNEEKLMCWLI